MVLIRKKNKRIGWHHVSGSLINTGERVEGNVRVSCKKTCLRVEIHAFNKNVLYKKQKTKLETSRKLAANFVKTNARVILKAFVHVLNDLFF